MYALIAARQYGGRVELLAISKSRRVLQRKWRKLIEGEDRLAQYKCVGILSPAGLLNYHGEPIRPSEIGYVDVRFMLMHAEPHTL